MALALTLMAGASLAATGPALAAAGPPAGRAYELVSPVDPLGSPAGIDSAGQPYPGFAGEDGNRIVFGANASVGETTSGAQNPFIFGRRTEHGWTASLATRSTDYGDTAIEFVSSEPKWAAVTSDASRLAFFPSRSYGPPNTITTLGVQAYQTVDGGLPVWLSAPTDGLPGGVLAVTPNGVSSADLSTTVFASNARLTAETASGGGIYANRGGRLRLVNRDVDGTPVAATLTAASAGVSQAPAQIYRNAVSADGATVLFAAGSASSPTALYVRDLDAETTRKLTDMPKALGGTWGGSTPSSMAVPGSLAFSAPGAPIVYFRTAENLAGATGSGDKIYRANRDTGAIAYVPEIDGPPVGVSDDGSRVLFLRPPASAGQGWTIRYWDAATPSTSTPLGTTSGTSSLQTNSVRAAKDGRTWVFTSTGSLDPDRPPVNATKLEVYRWTIGAAAPTCLSCTTTDGLTRLYGATMDQGETVNTEGVKNPSGWTNPARKLAVAQTSRAISDDGTRIAFDTPNRLVPEDHNDLRDAYLWDANAAPGRQLQLLSSGDSRATGPAYFIDMSASGDDVFFATQDGLVPEDVDRAYDMYDARIGGGFPEDPDSPCSGTVCRAPVTAPPVAPTERSLTFAGDGNVESVAPVPGPAPVTPAVSASSRTVTGTVVSLPVKVSVAGDIAVSGSSVAKVARTVGKAGTYRVKVTLSAKARKTLAKKHRVAVKVKVTLTPDSGKAVSKTVTVTFKQAKKQAKKRAAVSVSSRHASDTKGGR